MGRGAGAPLTIGRSGELASLAAAIDDAAAGIGSLVLVGGEAGIGKSHLLRIAADEAERRGLAVRAAGGEPLEQQLPFGVAERALGPLAPVGDVVHRYRGHEAIIDRVEAAATDGPLALVVDDLQWVDEPTLAALVMLARRAPSLPLLMVLAHRPTPPLPEGYLDRFAELARRTLAPAALSTEHLDELVAAELGAAPDAELHRLLAGANGNPFLALELVRSLAEEAALHVDADAGVARSSFHGLPPTLRQTVMRRVRSRCPNAADVLRVGAVFGGPFDVADVAAVLDRGAASLHTAIGEALAAGLLEEEDHLLRFRHDLIREAVYADIPAAIRTSLHRLVADVLVAGSAPPTAVVGHLLAGGSGGPDGRERLRRAADELALADPAIALDVLERALALGGDEARRAEMLLDRIGLLAATGRIADADAAARELGAEAVPVAVRARAGVARAEVLLLAGDAARAVDVLDEARALDALAGHDAALLDADLAWARLATFDVDGAARDAGAALRWAEAHGDAQVAASALAVQCRLAAFTVDFAGAVELGRRAVARSRGTAAVTRRTPHFYLGLALLNADRLDEARSTFVEGRRLAEANGAPAAIAVYHAATITCCFQSGDWDDAIAEAEAARSLHADVGTRRELLQMESMLGLMSFHRGDYAAAEAARSRAEADFATPGHDVGGIIWLLWLRAAFAEAAGDHRDAADQLGAAFDLAVELGIHSVKLWFGPEVVRLALVAGAEDRAAAVAAEVGAVAERARTPTATGAAAACAGMVRHDDDLLRQATDAYRRSGRRPDLAMACEARGGLAAAARRAEDAVAAYTAAIDAYEQLGAGHDLRRVRARMRELGVRSGSRERRGRPTTGPASLTPAEQAVLDLVQQGLANGAIAERLYISRRTVETHVGRLYAKLGVRTRVALATAVAPAGSADAVTPSATAPSKPSP